MDGWVHGHTAAQGHVCPQTDACPQKHPCPRCRVPSSFRDGDNAKPPALAQPEGHKAAHKEHSLAAGCPHGQDTSMGTGSLVPQPRTLQQIQLRGSGPHTRELQELLRQQQFHTHLSS